MYRYSHPHIYIIYESEVRIYKRKQESKKSRKQELDQESDQENKKKERKQEIDQKSYQEKRNFFLFS